MKEALLIIDVQNDYFPGGANPLHRAEEAEAVIQTLLQESRAAGRPVIFMQHFNGPEDSFFRPGTAGAELSERIRPEPGDKVIVKYAPNSFLNTVAQSRSTLLKRSKKVPPRSGARTIE